MNRWNTVSSPERHGLFDEIAVVGKAFASATRLEIIELLTHGEQSVDSIAGALDLKTTTASAHLQILRMSNLVRTRKDGQHVRYRLASQEVAGLFDVLHRVATENSAEVGRALDSYLGTGDVDALSQEEMLERLDRDDVTVIDVREPHEFAQGHLPGSVNIPLGQIAERLEDLDADHEIVAYCRGAWCVLAHDAVRLLSSHGRSATRLRDGIREWTLAGLPLERTA